MIPEFNRRVVRPVECLNGGWVLIKDHYWLFFGLSFVAILLASMGPFGILLGPMMCGLYLCYFAKMRGETPSFDLLFKGFNYFAKSFLVGLVLVLPAVILVTVSHLLVWGSVFMLGARHARPDGWMFGGAIIGVVVLIGCTSLVLSLIALLITFSFPLIVERQMSAGEALKLSARAVLDNAGGMLGLLLLNIVISWAALLCCCIGSYLWMPIGMAAYAVAYRAIFPELNASASPKVEGQL